VYGKFALPLHLPNVFLTPVLYDVLHEQGGAAVDDGRHAFSKRWAHKSFLLRLWRAGDEQGLVWRASLKSASEGERVGFASLEELFEFLRTETSEKPTEDQDAE
jgi:hypothetical protein